MRRKSGFTLVELLATIVVLSVIILAATPAVLSIAKKIRTSMYCTKVEMVKKAGQMYGQENVLNERCNIDNNAYNCKKITVNDLINKKFITPDKNNTILTDPRDKSSMNTTSLIVYSKYNKFYTIVDVIGCGDIISASIGYDVFLVLNGGTLSESFPSIINEGDTITLPIPIKSGYIFTGWTVNGTGSSITDNILTIGTEELTLTANWVINSYTLTVNANSGTWSGTTPQTVNYGSSVTINNPTKAYYNFNGWTVTGANSSINGTTFTMGSENTVLTAKWTANYYSLTVNANGGTWNGTTPQSIVIGNSVTINDPIKSGYVFLGWTVSGTGSSINGTTFTMGTNNATITANWMTTTPYTFAYTGGSQSFTAPESGYYKIELWGAQGGNSQSKGAYVSGYIYLEKNNIIYIYVGQGLNIVGNSTSFNAGTGSSGGWPGGGATDIRLVGGAWNNSTSINSRIMVASGSGAGAGNSNTTLGAGGGLIGNSGGGTIGGTQLTYGPSSYVQSSFGIANGGCAGGNGYYPGGGEACASGAGGGSSFISGYAGVNAITSSSSLTPTYNTKHYSNNYFINGSMVAGVNSGNGSAKITYVSKDAPTRINTTLNNVRYIKDCINGSSGNAYNIWLELQAIYQGTNVAKGKTVTGTASQNPSWPYSRITDGDISTSNYSYTDSTGLQCVTVDLGQAYNLDEIAVWHYWGDGRTYYSNDTYVSSDNSNWKYAIANTDAETSQGKRVNAYQSSPVYNSVKNYGYTGVVQSFIAVVPGYYKLETWGAQGGSYNAGCLGGYGGYSVGNYYASAGTTLYIYVGGVGLGDAVHSAKAGGYNGGGSATSNSDGNSRESSGGGATHIATTTGLLSTLSSSQANIIIVAGGGGAGGGNAAIACVSGGNGGGISGGNGTLYYESGSVYGYGIGGTQTAGGGYYSPITSSTVVGYGTFGLGYTSITAGSGGGYYGGGVGIYSGGGGSGYIGNSNLTSKAMYCYNCTTSSNASTLTYSTTNVSSSAISNYAKSGYGYARITYIGS